MTQEHDKAAERFDDDAIIATSQVILREKGSLPWASFTIGAFTISRMGDGKIWITHESGEAGAFDAEILERHIGKFYAEHF